MEGGNRSPWETGEERPLRDWQRNTWYGPAPLNENPFDEPEDAPELKEVRSQNLNDRSGEFWQEAGARQATGGYHFGDSSPRETEPRPQRLPKEKKRRPGRTILILAAAAAILWAALYYGVFVVRNIQIIGNSQVPDGEMIRLSGIRTGMPLFSVNTQEVERKLEQNPVLKFRYMEKKLPDTLIISVREREACCWMTWNGIMYTMDKQRAVLFETEDMTIQPSELVRVSGLEIRAGAMTGQTLVLDSVEQQMVFTNLFLEMKVLGCTRLIKEADLSNLNSLLLTTRDGFTVALGDSSNIHAKLRAMLLTREELLKRNYQGGVINVTLPETPIFSPAIN